MNKACPNPITAYEMDTLIILAEARNHAGGVPASERDKLDVLIKKLKAHKHLNRSK